MQLKVLAGGNFQSKATASAIEDILINEQAAIGLGFRDYAKAVGQLIKTSGTTQMRITGVLKNFNYESPGFPVSPLAFRTSLDACNFLYISVGNNVDRQAIAQKVVATLQTSFHGITVQPSWLDEDLQRADDQTATVSLLGLVTYTVQVKRKEISIRKIIGATEKQLVSMLSRRFIKLIFIAGFIAVPLGFLAGHLFLQNFVVRTGDSLFSAVLCFAFLLCIGLTTIISQTLRAATANPVKDLHTE
ncbi:MAG: hypothetical protein KF746_13330 [Chitinophagaceae bacterium]|nr:hypothetical protein [Chitinophagaceae bacterium]